MRKPLALGVLPVVLLALLAPVSVAQAAATPASSQPRPAVVHSRSASRICPRCIRAHEEFLASDAMRGRGSGTHDELVAATYVASELRQYGIAPGDHGTYVQQVPTMALKITSPPQLKIMPLAGKPSAEPVRWSYGKEFVVLALTQTKFSGRLQKLDSDKSVNPGDPRVGPGAVVLIAGSDQRKIRHAAFSVASEGAAAATLVLAPDDQLEHFQEAGGQMPKVSNRLEGDSANQKFNVLELNRDAFHALEQMPEGAGVEFEAPSSEEKGSTWNAVGIVRGSDSSLEHSAILLSAHLDHLGIGTPVNGDNIYNGADDDASGTTAVLEFARALGRGRHPQRTVIFALFGSEEMGGLGSMYFREHPPVPLNEIAANLEFEMIGRPDRAVEDDTLWLTGWERSNLGPALAAHGARLVGDPHPGENFFARSDNFVLAKKGVVAQTVSSYGLHGDYHQPSDDLAHLDFKHMDRTLGWLLGPVEWLVNSNFQPKWNAGGKP